MKQRGFGLIVYAVLAIAILASVAGLYAKVHGDGVDQGEGNIRKLWDAQNVKDRALGDQRRATSVKIASEAASNLAASQQAAGDYKAKYDLERKKRDPKKLAGCNPAPTGGSTKPGDTNPGAGPVRFSLGFLRDWNGIWTGDKGQPLFPDSPPLALKSADTLTGVGPGEVLDNHAANAESCSSDRRKLDALITQIERLRAGWK